MNILIFYNFVPQFVIRSLGPARRVVYDYSAWQDHLPRLIHTLSRKSSRELLRGQVTRVPLSRPKISLPKSLSPESTSNSGSAPPFIRPRGPRVPFFEVTSSLFCPIQKEHDLCMQDPRGHGPVRKEHDTCACGTHVFRVHHACTK